MFDVNPAKLAALLSTVKTVAILGAKDVPNHPVDNVGRYLLAHGFTVYPVHPKRKDVWGLPTYTSLTDIPDPVDLVDVFRAPQFCAEHAREALALTAPPKLFWMQLGIRSAEARAVLADSPIEVVEDICLMVFHQEHCLER